MSISKIIVIFTEGDTDLVFFKKLINHLRIENENTPKIIFKNLKI